MVTALIIVTYLVYGSYLVFQLFSHKALYDERHMDVFRSTRYTPRDKKTAANGETTSEVNGSSIPLTGVTGERYQGSPAASVSGDHDIEATTAAPSVVVEEEEEEVPQMSVPMTIGLLAVVTVVSFCVYPVCAGAVPRCGPDVVADQCCLSSVRRSHRRVPC